MHFILFDEILEKHTVHSLERALVACGHKVTTTGPVWKGHFLPENNEDMVLIHKRVREICSLAPDVLFNFRPSSLLPEMVNELKQAGIHAVAWLADDPVLYHVCYRHVVEAYDTILHCGGENILSFYQERHGTTGFNFPFWTDDYEFKYSYNPARAEFDLVFLGNCDGKVRAKRYELLSSLPFKVRIYGKVKNDPCYLCAGYLESTKQISDALGKARCAISIPQSFGDYRGTAYDFPELADLGHFELPSRVIQYAAIGLPIISLEGKEPSRIFPELITCSNREELITKVGALIKDEVQLHSLSSAVYTRFRRSFSAEARAAFLESIIESPQNYVNLDVSERAVCFAAVLDEEPESAITATQPLDTSRLSFPAIEARRVPSVEQRDKLKDQLKAIKSSFSYRLGNMLVQAVRKPGRNTVFLPYRLVSLCLMELRRREKMAAGIPTAAKLPSAIVNARPARQPSGSSLNSRKEEPARILGRCKRIDIEYGDLLKQKLDIGEPFLLCVEREGIKYEFFIRPKQSKNLLIFGSGAYDHSKLKPPIFQRISWIHDIGESIVFYNDPTLYLGELRLGWGQGTPERFYLEEMSDILKEIIAISGFQKEKTYFYGSSGGGFMALILAGFLRGTTAIVNNPQTIVTNYYKRPVENLFSVTHPGKSVGEIEEKYANRLSVAEFYKSIAYVPRINYLQNAADKHHVKKHLIPFIEGLYEIGEESVFTKVRFDLYRDEKNAHGPVSKKETIDYINEVISSSQ